MKNSSGRRLSVKAPSDSGKVKKSDQSCGAVQSYSARQREPIGKHLASSLLCLKSVNQATEPALVAESRLFEQAQSRENKVERDLDASTAEVLVQHTDLVSAGEHGG
jgi:hypothetical protein